MSVNIFDLFELAGRKPNAISLGAISGFNVRPSGCLLTLGMRIGLLSKSIADNS